MWFIIDFPMFVVSKVLLRHQSIAKVHKKKQLTLVCRQLSALFLFRHLLCDGFLSVDLRTTFGVMTLICGDYKGRGKQSLKKS